MGHMHRVLANLVPGSVGDLVMMRTKAATNEFK